MGTIIMSTKKEGWDEELKKAAEVAILGAAAETARYHQTPELQPIIEKILAIQLVHTAREQVRSTSLIIH